MNLSIFPLKNLSKREEKRMDIKQTRYHNARYLLKNEALGVNDFAEKIGRSQSQTSAYVGENPTKNIGDKIARVIEAAFNKPYGWLDSINDEADMSSRSFGVPDDLVARVKPEDPPLLTAADGSVDNMLQITRDINKIRSEVRVLEKQKTEKTSELEESVISFCINQFQAQGCAIMHLTDAHPDHAFYHHTTYSNSPYDLIIETPDKNLIGFYFWVITLKQFRTPLPVFNIDVDMPHIEAKLALFIFDLVDFHFFFVPLLDVLQTNNPILTVDYVNKEIDQDDGVIMRIPEVTDCKIGKKSIMHLIDKVDLSLSDIGSTEQILKLKEYLEAKIRQLEGNIKK